MTVSTISAVPRANATNSAIAVADREVGTEELQAALLAVRVVLRLLRFHRVIGARHQLRGHRTREICDRRLHLGCVEPATDGGQDVAFEHAADRGPDVPLERDRERRCDLVAQAAACAREHRMRRALSELLDLRDVLVGERGAHRRVHDAMGELARGRRDVLVHAVADRLADVHLPPRLVQLRPAHAVEDATHDRRGEIVHRGAHLRRVHDATEPRAVLLLVERLERLLHHATRDSFADLLADRLGSLCTHAHQRRHGEQQRRRDHAQYSTVWTVSHRAPFPPHNDSTSCKAGAAEVGWVSTTTRELAAAVRSVSSVYDTRARTSFVCLRVATSASLHRAASPVALDSTCASLWV